MKQLLVNSVFKMILSTKQLLLIHFNKIELWNITTNYYKKEEDKCYIDKFMNISKLMGEGNSNCQIIYLAN
jgi:hypothetical protein